jgi:membrane-associated phospholipid phosphatase
MTPARATPARAVLHARAVLLVAGAGFLALALTVGLLGGVPADTAVREAMLDLATPAVVALMRIVNYGGDKIVLGPATLVLLLASARARRRWWLWLALMALAPLAEGVLKEIVARPRPEGGGLAFPSGHATAAAAYFGAVAYLAGSAPSRAVCLGLRLVALVAVLAVAAARVVLGAHWPSDALGGIALGAALVALAALVDESRERAGR